MNQDTNTNQSSNDANHTVVGVYENYNDAKNTVEALVGAGFSRSRVQLNPESDSAGPSAATGHQEKSSGVGGFFRSLFGANDQDQYGDVYDESVRRGHYVLTVHAHSDHDVGIVTDIMNRFNAVDIDERADQWRTQGWTGHDASAPRYTEDEVASDRAAYASSRSSALSEENRTDVSSEERHTGDLSGEKRTAALSGEKHTADLSGEKRIPVVEEDIQVGKRQVNRGGVRVFTRVHETPVNESVQLREEHVKVERHPVDKAASQADMGAFKEGSIEVRENAEKPVVNKSARVVEEVAVGKETKQRTETINDTVKRTDVDVERLSSSDSGRVDSTLDDTEYRNHWKSNFGTSGERYEDYAPAYSYGSRMADSERYRNARWEEIEPQLRNDWESTHPGSNWDKVKDAVRYGTQHRTGNR